MFNKIINEQIILFALAFEAVKEFSKIESLM